MKLSPSAETASEPKARFFNRTTPPHILTLVLIAGIGALNMNILLPSLPSISSYYDADYALVQLAVSGYLAMTAVLQLLTGPLSDRLGRRPVLLISFTLFIIATLLAATAETIETFLAARMAQAVIVTGIALSRAIVRDMVPMEQAASMIGYVTMGMTLVPMVGPTVGGLLEESFGWQSTFYFTAIAAVVVLFVVYFDLKETNQNRTTSMAAQFRSYPELLKSRRFWGFTFTAMFASGSFFAFIGGAPYVARTYMNLSPSTLGLYFMCIGLGYMIGNFITGRFSGRLGIYKIMLNGNYVAGFGVAIAALYFMAGYSHPVGFFAPLFFVGVGNGLTMPSANAGMVSVRPHLAGSAAGLGGAIQIGGGAALSALAGIILTPTSGPLPLLYLMLACCGCGAIASIYTQNIAKQIELAEQNG